MKIILKFLLVLLIIWPVYAQSQESFPSPIIRRQQPQHEATPVAQKAEREEKSKNEKAATDRLLAHYTLALAIITAILAIFTGGLWYVTYRLSRAAKETNDRQAMEMRESLDIARASAEHTKESVDLARKEFISTHRPKIILRDAYCIDNEIDSPIEVHYILVNSGETTARIILSVLELKLIYGPGFGAETPPSIQPDQNDIGDLSLDPGEEVARTYSGTRCWRTDDGSRFKSNYSYEGVFFCGHIIYEDLNGIKRHTAFWRRYDLDTSRFCFSKDPAFESFDYAD